MVLVRSCRRYSLRRASNLYQARGRPHRRRLGRIRCRGDGRIVNLSLPCVSLAGEPLESAIQCVRNFLFRSHRSLCRSGHDSVLSAFSTRWSAVGRSGYFSRRRGHHGRRWYFIFPRSSVLAAYARDRAGDYWITFVAALRLCKQFLGLPLCRTVCRNSG